MNDDILNQWDAAAENFSAWQTRSYNNRFNRVIVSHLLGNLTGLHVLDAGCGEGSYSQLLKDLGANVIGCDGSEKMLEIARQKYPSIPFEKVDLHLPLPYPDHHFDLVFCNQVLMDFDPINQFVCEANRILKPDGKFFLVIVHPAFFTGEWEFDAEGRKTCRRIFDCLGYQKEELDMWGQTTHFHRTISFYINSFAEKGLLIERMFEPSPMQFDHVMEDESLTRIPLFLVVLFRKMAEK